MILFKTFSAQNCNMICCNELMRWYIYQVLWLWCFYGEEHEIHNYTKIHVIYKGCTPLGDLDQDQ